MDGISLLEDLLYMGQCATIAACTLERRLYSASYLALNHLAERPGQLLTMSVVDKRKVDLYYKTFISSSLWAVVCVC